MARELEAVHQPALFYVIMVISVDPVEEPGSLPPNLMVYALQHSSRNSGSSTLR